MIDVYILNIDKNVEKNDFDRLLEYVSVEKKERVRRFQRFEDAQRSLLGDILARYAICKRTGIKNRDLGFRTNEYGKPLLITPQRVHFNISHSGNWVACAIDDNPVGIDVEIVKPISFEIAERFFSKDEYYELLNQAEEMRLKYFYMVWTLKESYIKAEGKGLSIPLDSFCVKFSDKDIKVLVGTNVTEYFFHQSFLDDNTVYAVCSQISNANRISYMNIESFFTKFKTL